MVWLTLYVIQLLFEGYFPCIQETTETRPKTECINDCAADSYRSPLRSLTTASTHLNTILSSMESHPSSMRATNGASKMMTSSEIPPGKLSVDANGDGRGLAPWEGVPGRVPTASLRLLLGITIGSEYRSFNALCERKR